VDTSKPYNEEVYDITKAYCNSAWSTIHSYITNMITTNIYYNIYYNNKNHNPMALK